MKKAFVLKSAVLATVAALGLTSAASAQLINEAFTNSSSVVGAAGATTPSSLAGNDYELFASTTTAGGFNIFTPSVDGGNGLQLSNENGLLAHVSEVTTFTNNGSFQVAFLMRRESTPVAASVRSEAFGVYLGDANAPCISFFTGTNASSAPTMGLGILTSAAANSGSTLGITGILDGEWVGFVVQFDPPTTVGGTDGGFHLWLDPATSAEAAFFSGGPGVTGGGAVASVALGSTAARPANLNLRPGALGFGGVLFGSTAGPTPTTSVDNIGVWDGPADLTGGDAPLLQNAIDHLAAARAAKVDTWLLQ